MVGHEIKSDKDGKEGEMRRRRVPAAMRGWVLTGGERGGYFGEYGDYAP
jgi:hypothetical protein